MKLPKNFIWVVLVCIVALVAYTIGNQGQTVRELTVGKEGIALKFDQLERLPENELEERQSELEGELKRIQEDIKDAPSAPSEQPLPAGLNLNGTWQSSHGSFYNISQYGSAVTIQEMNPIYGVTAIGQGQLSQNVVNINYTTALYTQGQGTLQVSDDGSQILGTFTDFSTGITTNAVLSR